MTSIGFTMLLAMTLGQANPTEVTPQLETAFAKSIAYEKQLQYSDAVKVLSDLGEAQQNSYFVQVRLGWLNYKNATYSEAQTAYQAALELMPNSTEAKLGLVLVVLAQARYAEAEALCQEVLAQDPGNYYANLRLAFALRNQLKFDQAEVVNNLLLERYPSDVSVLLEAGLVKVGQKNKEAADQIFLRVLLLDSENAIAIQQLGRVTKKKSWVVPNRTASAESLLSEGRSLASQTRYPEAIEFLQFVIEKSPQDPRPLYLLAFCQGSLKENAAAAVSFSAACELERQGFEFNWSQYMERIQGPKRAWMELERSRQLGAKSGR